MELRKDYILNRWVVISEGRAKRPIELVKKRAKKNEVCFFCLGNEKLTPPEIYRVEEKGNWKVRVFPNKFAAVELAGQREIRTDNRFYTFSSAYGSHEILVETPKHNKTMGQLDEENILSVLKTYKLRIEEMLCVEGIKYVTVFKNQGEAAGASLTHSHSQIISLSFVPPEITEKIDAIKKYQSCPYCDIINNEKNSYRRCFENDSFVSFTPYASRFNYEIMILPKNHITTFEKFEEKTFVDLASMMRKILQKVEALTSSYNLVLFYSPKGEDLHFHIEVLPRIATWAGFEFDSGIEINTVSPEYAASYYRDEHDNIQRV